MHEIIQEFRERMTGYIVEHIIVFEKHYVYWRKGTGRAFIKYLGDEI